MGKLKYSIVKATPHGPKFIINSDWKFESPVTGENQHFSFIAKK